MRHAFFPPLAVLLTLPFLVAADDKKDDPTASPEDAKVRLTREEEAILKLTNEAREKEKLPPLKLSPLLTKIARAHSANMAKQKQLSHELDGKDPQQRIKDAGYKAAWGGENVGMTNGDTPAGVFKSWMESQHHRENILREQYREIGIGMARAANGDLYYTQVFATPRQKR